jgi:hypothetical protein
VRETYGEDFAAEDRSDGPAPVAARQAAYYHHRGRKDIHYYHEDQTRLGLKKDTPISRVTAMAHALLVASKSMSAARLDVLPVVNRRTFTNSRAS